MGVTTLLPPVPNYTQYLVHCIEDTPAHLSYSQCASLTWAEMGSFGGKKEGVHRTEIKN